MSYNISNWKIRSLKLELPLDFDFQAWLATQPERDEKGYEKDGIRWCKEEQGEDEIHIATNLANQTWQLDLLNQSLSGTIVEQKLVTTALDWIGEFSGHLYSDILLPLFVEFKGELDAIVTWEGGDTIDHLTIKDGVITEKEIE